MSQKRRRPITREDSIKISIYASDSQELENIQAVKPV